MGTELKTECRQHLFEVTETRVHILNTTVCTTIKMAPRSVNLGCHFEESLISQIVVDKFDEFIFAGKDKMELEQWVV